MLRTALLYEVENYIRTYNRNPKKLTVPIRYTVPQPLKDLAEEITAVSGAWNPVEILTPDGKNSLQEKANFFNAFMDDKIYNPQFTYKYSREFDVETSRKKVQKCQKSLEKFHPRTKLHRLLKYALEYKISDDFATCDLIEGIQNRLESKISQALDYKYTDSDYDLYLLSLQEYYKKTQKTDPLKPKGILSAEEIAFLKSVTFHAEDMQKAFEWALNEYNLLKTKQNPNGYKVVIDDKATSIDVRDKSLKGPTIFIPKKRTAKGDKLLGLIAHEIEGHVRQSMNGHHLFLIGGGPLKIDDEMLYEGLAKRYDELYRRKFFGAKEVVPHPYYTFAIHKLQRGNSFHEIFTEQLSMRLHVKLKIRPDDDLPEYTDIDRKLLLKCMENSWNTTLRVMRGHRDTENPRGFSMTKDISYLRGWLVDKQLCQLDYGHINEAAIMTCQRGLEFMAQFDVSESDLPYPYKDVTTKYWYNVLRPQMKQKPNFLHLT